MDSEGQGNLVCCSPWGHKEPTQLRDWITITANLGLPDGKEHKVEERMSDP